VTNDSRKRPGEADKPDGPPQCPKCGSGMAKRMGGRFWGCKTYWDTGCRGRIPIDEVQADSRRVSKDLPGEFDVHAVGRQCSFFQSVALPASIVKAIETQGLDVRVVARFSQWRLDYPMPSNETLDPDLDHTLALAEDLLLRGSTPLCFPDLEDCVRLDESDHIPALQAVLQSVIASPTAPHIPLEFDEDFDSDEERLLLQELVGPETRSWSFQTQVILTSLAPNAQEELKLKRGDFLAVHASGERLVVEVDGTQHKEPQQRKEDEYRDKELKKAEIQVIRIPTHEVRERSGKNFDKLQESLRRVSQEHAGQKHPHRGIRWHRALHQLQLALVKALRTGHLNWGENARVVVELPEILGEDRQADKYLKMAVKTLEDFLRHLAKLWGIAWVPGSIRISRSVEGDGEPTTALRIRYQNRALSQPALAGAPFTISDVLLPRQLKVNSTSRTSRGSHFDGSEKDVEWFLRYLFRKKHFKEGQWQTVQRTLQGEDSIVLLPTGAGKSIAFQLAALLRPGTCIVVDPIIALIKDQLENLRSVGIDRCESVTSEHSPGDKTSIQALLTSGQYLFMYVAPERFQNDKFRKSLRALTEHDIISAVIVDEAHCVSEWGHDFRTAYLNLGRNTREYCKSGADYVPPLVALTGTASRPVLDDVQRDLEIEGRDAVVTPKSFDRPELRFRVIPCHSNEKHAQIGELISSYASKNTFVGPGPSGKAYTPAGIVFCPHVNGGYGTFSTADDLKRRLKTEVGHYSGNAPKKWNDKGSWSSAKQSAARKFKQDEVPLLVATKAFGMGIDKPNIRYTIHLGLPQSIEAFYQEAGRAGRDGDSAECSIIFSIDDRKRRRDLLDLATKLEDIRSFTKERLNADDLTRALYFHTNSFRGIKDELKDIRILLVKLKDLEKSRRVRLRWTDGDWGEKSKENNPETRSERALHRLVVLGMVSDYSKNSNHSEYDAHLTAFNRGAVTEAVTSYAKAYRVPRGEALRQDIDELPDSHSLQFLLSTAEFLLKFIYDTRELSRRNALREMVQAAEAAVEADNPDDVLRKRVVQYLGHTKWDKPLRALAQKTDSGAAAIKKILKKVRVQADYDEIRLRTGNLLADYGDAHNLHYMRGFTELLATDSDEPMAVDNLRAGTKLALESRLAPLALADAILTLVEEAVGSPRIAKITLTSMLDAEHLPRETAVHLVRTLPQDFASIAANRALSITAARVRKIFDMSED